MNWQRRPAIKGRSQQAAPITGIRGCCVLAAGGHSVAAPLSVVMNFIAM
jgi:hypothetical protein